jgi:predicted transcriptional regulator of viral defense system
MKKYLEELHKLRIFQLKDVEKLVGNLNSAKDLLHNYKKQKLINQVRRDLYVATDLATKTSMATKFEIAGKITPTSYLSYQSAMEFYGLAHQVFYNVWVSSGSRFNTFGFEGIEFQYCDSKSMAGVISANANSLISVTNLERTVIDCVDKIERCGGLEELIQCFSLITFLDEKLLLDYLHEYEKQFLYQKAGFILEYFKQEVKLSDNFFEECRRKMGKSTRYLTDPTESTHYFKGWKLCAPVNILSVLEQGGERYV